MATEALKSTSITDLDGYPSTSNGAPLRHIAGSGANGRLSEISDSITYTTGVTAPSTYKVIRLKSTCILKKLEWWSEGSGTTFTVNVGLYYSDSPVDGTKVANQGTALAATLFASALDAHAAAAPADLVYSSLTGDKINQPLWQAAGLSSDPGGCFDVVLVTTATNSGSETVHVRATFVEAA